MTVIHSQPGSVPGPIATRVIRVNINGAGLGGADIFTIESDDVSIAGLAIYSSTRFGINILQNSDVVHIWGNYIGTDSTGIAAGLGNTACGVISNYNVFGGIENTGITIGIKDNDAVPDANEGNLICSTVGVVLGGFEGDGISFWHTINSVVAGNIIGLNKNGLGLGFFNARNGLLLTVGSNMNIIGTNGNGVSDALEGNTISRSSQKGILFLPQLENNR